MTIKLKVKLASEKEDYFYLLTLDGVDYDKREEVERRVEFMAMDMIENKVIISYELEKEY